MEVEYTNFEGDLNEPCPYCGNVQKSHQVDLGAYKGKQYIHRQPCEEEQYEIRKRWVKRGITARIIFVLYDFISYLWGLIPFKEEIKLMFGFFKHLYISIRALVFLKSTKPKMHNTYEPSPRQ